MVKRIVSYLSLFSGIFSFLYIVYVTFVLARYYHSYQWERWIPNIEVLQIASIWAICLGGYGLLGKGSKPNRVRASIGLFLGLMFWLFFWYCWRYLIE